MIDEINMTSQTYSLVNIVTGTIYRYKEITVDTEHNCTLTYSPIDPDSKLQDIQLSFDGLPEVQDIIHELSGNPNLVVAAIVVLDGEQKNEGCPVCEEMGDEDSPENFEKHCQMFAERIRNMVQDAVDVGELDEAINAIEALRNELPDVMFKRISEIIRERAHDALKRVMTGGSL